VKVNAAGLDLIKSFEGLRLKAYKCSAGVDTIGYGHTSAAGAPVVKAGMTITAAEAEKILARDLGKYEQAVDKVVTVKPTPNQFSAMVSLCYNIGPGNFAGSSVVRRLNAGDVKGAAEAFLLWNKVHGRALAGLTRRREAERKLFLTPE
jgi:lysozyme